MSGVVVGTRLQRLYELQRQVTVAIEVELRRTVGDRPARACAPRVLRNSGPATSGDPTDPTSYEVKVWAVSQGLIPAVVRGRVSRELRAAYLEAQKAGGA